MSKLILILVLLASNASAQSRWYYVVRPGGVFEYIGEFETDGLAISSVTNCAPLKFTEAYQSILWFPTPVGGNVAWQPKNNAGGVAVGPLSRPRTVTRSAVMPPLPAPLVKSLIVAPPMPPIGIAHRFHDGQLSGVQAWMTNGTTNLWIFQVSTNLVDWHQAGNETAWPDWPGVRMTETGIQGQTFIRAHKL